MKIAKIFVLHRRLFFTILLLVWQSAFCKPDSTALLPAIRPGSIELGMGGSLTIIEGISNASVFVRSAFFKKLPGKNLIGLGLETGYTQIRSLDQLQLEGNVSWQRPIDNSSVYLHLAIGGGIQWEWIGSFRQTRFPIGLNAGFRVLLFPNAAVRFDYRYRRFWGDPVANFSQHQLVLGISMFFRNGD